MEQASTSSLSSHAMRPSSDWEKKIFRGATLAAAILVLLLLGGVAVALVKGAWPALAHFKLQFLTRQIWNPVTEKFGAPGGDLRHHRHLDHRDGGGHPLSFGISIFLTDLCPPWLKRPVGTAVELLAAVPSIIFRHLGHVRVCAHPATTVQPWLIDHLGPCPGSGCCFRGPPFGIGILTASLVLSIMVLPFIASVMRDVFETVPDVLRESAYGQVPRPGKSSGRWYCHTHAPASSGHHAGLGRALGRPWPSPL